MAELQYGYIDLLSPATVQ